jgi:acyl dehydratase
MQYRTFTSTDQLAFAELSGDYNPLHLNPFIARRLLFGSVVLHGIHALLWALECCIKDKKGNFNLHSVKAIFSKPIRVGEKIGLAVQDEDDKHLRIELLCDGSIVTTIEVELEESEQQKFGYLEDCFPQKL